MPSDPQSPSRPLDAPLAGAGASSPSTVSGEGAPAAVAGPDLAPSTEWADVALLQRVRAGDASAAAELYRRYAPDARRFARSLVPATDVDDVVAESFARVLRALRQQAGPVDHPVRYLMVTVRTTAIGLLDRRRRERVVLERLHVDGAVHQAHPWLHDEALFAAFRALTLRHRQALWWTEVDGLSAGEVGARLGLSASATAALTYRARRALRHRYLAQRDGGSVAR